MKSILRYKSISINPFNVWKIYFYLSLFPSILIFLSQKRLDLILYFLVISTLLSIIYIVLSYSMISYDGKKLKIKSHFKDLQIDKIEDIKTWWCYDFGRSTIEFSGNGTEGKTRAHVNKMNCYVKFRSSDDEVYIYEQIHLGNKFPNNHPYLYNQEVDPNRLVKVWDIDNCLKKLDIKVITKQQ